MGLAAVVQAAYLLLISLEESALHQGSDRRQGMSRVEQFVAGDLHRRFLTALTFQRVPVRQSEIINKSPLLPVGPLEHVQGDMQGLFATELRCKADIGLRPGAVAVLSLQSCGEGGLIHLTDGRHVVVGDPVPESQLAVEQDGRSIEDLKDGLDLRHTGDRHHCAP